MAINLNTVIAELQFLQELVNDDSTDPRLKELMQNARIDLAKVSKSLGLGDDPIPKGA